MREVLRWQLACGVQRVRSHVDVCDPRHALHALVDLREEFAGLLDLQLVAFPQQGIFGFDGGRDLMRRAVEIGADVVGGSRTTSSPARTAWSRWVRVRAGRGARAAGRHPLRRDRRRPRPLRRGHGRRDDQARDDRPGHRQPHHGDALLQQAYANRLITNIARAGLHLVPTRWTTPCSRAASTPGRCGAGTPGSRS